MPVLADAIGETPETVMVTHALRRGACRAWVLGNAVRPRAAVVQLASFPDEPVAFGVDPWNLLAVLRQAGQWTAVNVPVFLGAKLAAALKRLTGKACTLTEEIYSVLLRRKKSTVSFSSQRQTWERRPFVSSLLMIYR